MYEGVGCWVRGLVFRVSGFGFQVSGFGVRVPGFGFRVSGSGFWFLVLGFGIRDSDFGFRVSGSGFRVSGFGFQGSGFGRTSLGPRNSPTRLCPGFGFRTSTGCEDSCKQGSTPYGGELQILFAKGLDSPLSQECGSYKTVNARFWFWLPDKSPQTALSCSLFALSCSLFA